MYPFAAIHIAVSLGDLSHYQFPSIPNQFSDFSPGFTVKANSEPRPSSKDPAGKAAEMLFVSNSPFNIGHGLLTSSRTQR